MNSTPRQRLSEHPLIVKLVSLCLDPDDFVIFGSGPLLAHGLRRDIADLDVLARGRAWRRALDRRDYGIDIGPHSDQLMLRFFGGAIEVSQHWIDGSWDVDQLIDTADMFTVDTAHGRRRLRFARLATVWNYKRDLKRAKDFHDLAVMRPMLSRDHPATGSPPMLSGT